MVVCVWWVNRSSQHDEAHLPTLAKLLKVQPTFITDRGGAL